MVQFDDEMLPEYDFSQLGQPIRGKHAKAMRQGYSVTIHHPDGTTIHREVFLQDTNSNAPIYYGEKRILVVCETKVALESEALRKLPA
jgi:hypothetical protein